jgi:N-methylhydantoinase A/oxoprolinase/acetone carboxylase beta subunit
MTLDTERPRRLAREFARKLNLNEFELAEGIVQVDNSNMERALRVISVQRGYDPRDFALLAFGGAGGMHACDLARALDIQTVLVPEYAGVLSALGMLFADYTKHYSQTVLQPVNAVSDQNLETAFEDLIRIARAELSAEGFDETAMSIERAVDLRYLGQSYEITVPFNEGYRAEFDRRHDQLYGYRNKNRTVEIVNVRVKAVGRTVKPALPHQEKGARRAPVPVRILRATFKGESKPVPLFARESLIAGMKADGPAIIFAAQSTTVVPPDWRFRLDSAGTLVLARHSFRDAR